MIRPGAMAFLLAGLHPCHSIVYSLLIFGALTADALFGYRDRLQEECADVDAS